MLGGHAAAAPFEGSVRQRGGPRAEGRHRSDCVTHASSRRPSPASGGGLDEAVAARFLYGDYFEFRPTFKLVLVTNHRRHVDGDDEAICARLLLVPFEVSFLGREEVALRETLESELPGILRCAVEGCLASGFHRYFRECRHSRHSAGRRGAVSLAVRLLKPRDLAKRAGVPKTQIYRLAGDGPSRT